jgi:hypothetical protein
LGSLETTVMPFCCFGDYNLEITISLQGLGQSGPKRKVGLGTGLEQSTAAHSHDWDERPHPVAHLPKSLPLPTYECLHMLFFSSLLGGVAVGRGHHHVWLAALDVCWALSMDSLSYGRRSRCAQGPASLCTSSPVCFPSSPCGGRLRA